ncbi:MAG TPA: hypothetical protein VFE50_21400 [Cyclobacteriaceae bacterium]|nr:hypothetical protein [Cyclobacteriaceae bacterium]
MNWNKALTFQHDSPRCAIQVKVNLPGRIEPISWQKGRHNLLTYTIYTFNEFDNPSVRSTRR